MIQIDYDILFSVRAVLLAADNQPSGKIAADRWRFTPSAATKHRMKAANMIFREMDGLGLLIATPTAYQVENNSEVAVFELEQTLRFTIEVSLSSRGLSRYIDRGPGPKDGSEQFPAEQQTFFDQAFPNRRPSYLLDNARLADPGPQGPVGVTDAIAPPVGILRFDKSTYSNIILKGPLPAEDTIPPATLVNIVNGEPSAVENTVAFEYYPTDLPEGKYRLSGNKRQEDDSSKAFTGEIFLNGGVPVAPPLAYLDIEIPPGSTRTGDLNFLLRFREHAPANDDGDSN